MTKQKIKKLKTYILNIKKKHKYIKNKNIAFSESLKYTNTKTNRQPQVETAHKPPNKHKKKNNTYGQFKNKKNKKIKNIYIKQTNKTKQNKQTN